MGTEAHGGVLNLSPGDAVLVIDVFNTFDHDDGEALLDSFRERKPRMEQAIDLARQERIPLVYVNDAHGGWDSDVQALLRETLSAKGGELVDTLRPNTGEPVLLKHRYSAFDHTPLDILLEELGVTRVLLIGAATEGCIVQTAIDAREMGLQASIIVDACATAKSELEAVALRYAENVVGVRLERITRAE
jgi:nicotinamidase-related amidase